VRREAIEASVAVVMGRPIAVSAEASWSRLSSVSGFRSYGAVNGAAGDAQTSIAEKLSVWLVSSARQVTEAGVNRCGSLRTFCIGSPARRPFAAQPPAARRRERPCCYLIRGRFHKRALQ
jgi:hypothetical protein